MKNKWNKRIKNVTWGYRDRFNEALKRIKETGYLDMPDDASYKTFDKTYMELVGKDYCTDHAADVFLKALDKKLSWIISIPELMESWSGYGLKLLEIKLYYAIRYFELWNNNPTITDPSEMRMIMNQISRIEAAVGISNAISFLEGYPYIRKVLKVEKVCSFVEEGIRMFDKKPSMPDRFFKLELARARILIEQISRRCCLEDIRPRLERLLRSICKDEFGIEKTQKLDSDELIEKGSDTVFFGTSLYLPAVVSMFDDTHKNTKWYLAAIYSNAFSRLFKGFPIMHGIKGFESSEIFLKNTGIDYGILEQDLFYSIDIYRIFRFAFRIFPGAKKIITSVISLCEQKCLLPWEILNRMVLNNTDKCDSFYDIVRFLPSIKHSFINIFKDNDKLHIRPQNKKQFLVANLKKTKKIMRKVEA